MISFKDGPEYCERLKRPFVPPKITLAEVHKAVPKHLFKKNNWIGAYYVARDIALAAALVRFATLIGPLARGNFWGLVPNGWPLTIAKSAMWLFYWWFQGLVGGGMFCMGHDLGHGAIFTSKKANNFVGFCLHTVLMIPYFSWRTTHHKHHKGTGSVERDESYVPFTRADYKMPPREKAHGFNYAEAFEETPIVTLSKILFMQSVGWWLYMTINAMGSKRYPPGTNLLYPSSAIFKKEQRNDVIMSNLALTCMACFLVYLGFWNTLMYWFVPYLLTNHWIIMFTFLHHSDPSIPHYREAEWTFLRGALATIDRPLLGWMGRFFLHNISHDHIAHHIFATAPFYNGPEITAAIRPVLGDDYNYDSTNSFRVLWRSFVECLYIEEEGDIVFYSNRHGKVLREVAVDKVQALKASGWDQQVQALDKTLDTLQDDQSE